MDRVVLCSGLEKEFGDGDSKNRVLKGIDVEVSESELTLLVGPSGCGKTTLISIIAGLLYPTRGRVEVLGQDLGALSDRARVSFRGHHIGFVFQQYNLLPALSAVENAAVPLIIHGMTRARACERAAETLTVLGLGGRLDAVPSQLSGGEQQRVAFARALVHEPNLLVCDEPTSALDGHAGQQVMAILREAAVKPGRAVVVVTHDSRVFGFGDNLIEMADGRIDRVERVRAGYRASDTPGAPPSAAGARP
jgi:putative ABC transport system ATP-binding protein